MALIDCKECNKQISDKAKSCPSCGAINKANALGFFGWIFVLFATIPIVVVVLALIAPNEDYQPRVKSKEQLMQEELDRFAESCKNGHASDCDNERALSNLLNMAK